MVVMMLSVGVKDGFGQACSACEPTCGAGATAGGNCAFSQGSSSSASGNSSIAIGTGTNASATNSVAIGAGSRSTAFGAHAFGTRAWADVQDGFAIGMQVRSNAQDGYIFGKGITDTGQPLFINGMANTMMLGMNSDVPTIFIGNSGGLPDSYGNVGIGNITAPASLLHVRDTMRVGLTSQANGSLIFNNTAGGTIKFHTPTTLTSHIYTWPSAQASASGQVLTNDGTGVLSWAPAGTTSGSWLVAGNSGTNASTNFLGTQDNVDLVLRTFNIEKMRVKAAGNVGIGTAAPGARLHVIQTANNGFEGVARFSITGVSSDQRLTINNTSGNSSFYEPGVSGRTDQAAYSALTLQGFITPAANSGTEPMMSSKPP